MQQGIAQKIQHNLDKKKVLTACQGELCINCQSSNPLFCTVFTTKETAQNPTQHMLDYASNCVVSYQ